MARRRKTVIEEDVPESEVKYDDIHNKDVSEVVSEAAQSDSKAPNDIERKAAEEPEKKDEEEVDIELEELDTEALKKEAVDAAKAEMADLLSPKKTEEATDEYEEWSKKVFDETGKPPNWKQAADFIKEQTKRELKAEQEAAEKEKSDKADADAKAKEAATAEWNRFVDTELNDLYEEGKLPRIKDKDDETDSGVVARRALFQTMLDVNSKRIAEGKQPEYSIYKIFHKYYKSPTRQPAGADAPVSAGTRGGTGGAEPEEKLSYNEIHNTPWGAFMDKITRK